MDCGGQDTSYPHLKDGGTVPGKEHGGWEQSASWPQCSFPDTVTIEQVNALHIFNFCISH